ncbi:MAG: LysE family translocator [Prevotella sp.]|nr:LysE family translocator [Prevotella sp.]MCR5152371.1 LysE family translocator [Prevotella sp.]
MTIPSGLEQFYIDIPTLIFKGILIGILASAPMGPVGILCVQRTINKGRWYGMVTGLGAALSDIIYAAITGFGMSFVMDFVTNEENKSYLQIVGSVILLIFGIFTWRTDPTKNMHERAKKNKGTLTSNGVTAFLVTLSNPLIIFLFMACFAQLAFVLPDRPWWEVLIGFVSIFIGALMWWFGLTWLLDKVRGKFDRSSIVLINRVIGCVVIIVSLIILIGKIFNLYTFY